LEDSNADTSGRREFWNRCGTIATILLGGSSSVLAVPAAHAAMKSDQKVFKVGKDLTVDEAKTRFRQGQESIAYLLDNFDTICEGGGDNVRRYLGTVGTTSGLYGIGKVLKLLSSEADDLVEYNEAAEEFNAALTGAEGSAYMAIFTESSTSGVPASKYFKDCKTEALRVQQKMTEIAKQLNIQ